MKIGLVVYGSLDTLSGGYLYDRMLVRALRAHGCHVDILSLPWRNYIAHLSDNLRWHWIKTVGNAGYDVILQDELNHPSLFLANRYLRRSFRGPLVSIVHHLRSEEDHPNLRKRLYRAVETAYLRTVDGFIFNSNTTRQLVETHTPKPRPGIVAVPAADHITPPSAADVNTRIQARSRSTAPLRILFVGNLTARKGLHIVLDALGHLTPMSFALDIVGSAQVDPAYTARVHRQAARLQHRHTLNWHGRVDDATLRRLYAEADLLVVPSYEGFGIVYLEAMAFGLPVIASTQGAAPELITPGKNGYLVSPTAELDLAEILMRYAENRLLLAEHGAEGRRFFESSPTWQQSMDIAYQWLHEISGATK